jgi:sporulation protein YlmC with PRC-barrel domain
MSDAPTQQQVGDYMADDIIGTKIRNAQDENIGSVSDLVIDNDGRVKAVVISVGGFLGIGDKHVAVPWSQLQVRADASGAGTTGATTGTGGTPAATREPVVVVNRPRTSSRRHLSSRPWRSRAARVTAPARRRAGHRPPRRQNKGGEQGALVAAP